MRQRAEVVAHQLAKGGAGADPGTAKLAETRDKVQRAWGVVGEMLMRDGQAGLSAQVRRFADQMPSPATEREWVAAELVKNKHDPRAYGSSTR